MALALMLASRSEFGVARELAERVFALAQRLGEPGTLARAHHVLGLVRFHTGQFMSARKHLEPAIELFGAFPPGNWGGYGAYFARYAPIYLIGALVILGYPSSALRRAHELLIAVGRASDPNSIAIELTAYLLAHLLVRDTRMVREKADEQFSIAIEREMPFNKLAATFFRGWAMASAGAIDDGIADMRRYTSDPWVAEAPATVHMLVALAETYGKNRRAEEGLDLVARGVATAEKTGVRAADAELHRLKGELLMIKEPGNVAEAECCLRTAIDVARRQSARLFELRATVSLARLLRDTNRRDEARTMLSDIYNWFTEGFDTADRKDAKALLDELAR